MKNFALVLVPGAKSIEKEGDVLVVCFNFMEAPKKIKHWWAGLNGCVAIQMTTLERKSNVWRRYGSEAVVDARFIGKCEFACQVEEGGERAGWEGDWIIPIFGYGLKGPAWLCQRPQDLAMLWQSRAGGEAVAFDFRPDFLKPEDTTKQGFCVFPSWDVFYKLMTFIPPSMRNFYEIGRGNVRVWLFIDFDGVLKDFPELRNWTKLEIVNLLFACIQKAWEEDEKCPIGKENTYVFDSSADWKISLHLVSAPNCPVCWKNTQALKSFVIKVRELAFIALGLKEAARSKLIDLSVYDLNHKFRIVLQTKMGENRPKLFSIELSGSTPPPRTIQDTLVCKTVNALEMTSIFERKFPLLYQTLNEYRVEKGTHTHRWGLEGRELFNVPSPVIEQLSKIMAKEFSRFPFSLHEAPGSAPFLPLKLVFDFDKFIGQIEADLLFPLCKHLSETFQVNNFDVCLMESPPRKDAGEGEQFLHLAFQIQTPSYRQYKQIGKDLQKQFSHLDLISALRTVYSAKADGRVNDYKNCYNWKDGKLGQAEKKTLVEVIECCSMFAGLAGLPTIKVVEEEEEREEEHEVIHDGKLQSWMEKEWRARNGNQVKITLVENFPNYIQTRTNCTVCMFRGKSHKTQTQKGNFFPGQKIWIQSCWSSSCRGKSQVWPLMYPVPPTVRLSFMDIAILLYPEDAILWKEAKFKMWRIGRYFGCSLIQYQWRDPFALVRRDKENNCIEITRSTNEQWDLFPDFASCNDPKQARQLLELTDSWISSLGVSIIPIGILNLDSDLQICYYSSENVKAAPALIVSIRLGTCNKSRVPPELRVRLFAFAVNCLSYKPSQKSKASEEWANCGIPKENIFYLTDPADQDLRFPDNFPALTDGMKLILDGTMGCGKTNLVKNMRNPNDPFLYICALRSLAKNAARQFGIELYLDENEKVRKDLATVKSLAIVINSLWHLDENTSPKLAFWDEFRQILLAYPMIENASKVWDQMCRMICSHNGIQVFADASISPELEGWLLCSLVDPASIYVIIKDTERNPWNNVRCYEMLGDECEAWTSALEIADSGRTFMPVNEELAVHVAEQLFKGKNGAFLCGSSKKDQGYKELTESTDKWGSLDLLCASGVISSGLSCLRKIFVNCINFFSNRSDNSWDNAQKWIRQRIAYDFFFFYFRNRGAVHSQLTVDDFENLSKWTDKELLKYYKGEEIRGRFWRKFLEFSVKSAYLVSEDHVHFRRNVIRRLNARNATIQFMAPVGMAKHNEIKNMLFTQQKAQRAIASILRARILSREEFKQLSQTNEDPDAVTRTYLSIKYKIPQLPEFYEHFAEVVTEHFARKLPQRLQCLSETVLESVNSLAHYDKQQQQEEAPQLRSHGMLQKEMTRQILSDIFGIDAEWICQPLAYETELVGFKLTTEMIEERDLFNALDKVLSSGPYRELNLKNPIAFPQFGKSKDEASSVKNFLKAFLKKARAIPLIRKTSRPRVDGKKLSIPYLALDYPKLVISVLGYQAPESSKQVVKVTSLRQEGPVLIINGNIKVPFQNQGQFATGGDREITNFPYRWAWFLKGCVYRFSTTKDYDLAALRALLVRNGYTLVDRMTYIATQEAMLEIDWIRNDMTDVSVYNGQGKPVGTYLLESMLEF